MKRLLIFSFLILLAVPCFGAWTDKYVIVGGAGAKNGADEANAWGITDALTYCGANSCAGFRINVKAGTYTMAADLTFGGYAAAAPSTTAPLWWRGYNTTIGDLDASHALALPRIDADTATDQVIISGGHQFFSNLNITSVNTEANGAVYITGGSVTLLRCRIVNSAANSASYAITTNTNGNNNILACYISANDAANRNLSLTIGTNLMGCTVHGGIIGVLHSSTGAIYSNVIDNPVTTGISLGQTTQGIFVVGNTIYSAGADAILITAVPTTGTSFIANNIFASNGGRGIYQNTGADTNLVRAFSNLYYGNGTEGSTGLTEQGYSAGWTDLSTALMAKLASADPIPNAATDDFNLASTQKALAFPGAFENETFTGYMDHGAVQVSASGGSSFIALILPALLIGSALFTVNRFML